MAARFLLGCPATQVFELPTFRQGLPRRKIEDDCILYVSLGAWDEEFYFESEEEPENFYHCLQELAIELAEEIGLIPDYTILDVFENRYNATLYGDKS